MLSLLGPSSVPSQGTKIPEAKWQSQKKKKKALFERSGFVSKACEL